MRRVTAAHKQGIKAEPQLLHRDRQVSGDEIFFYLSYLLVLDVRVFPICHKNGTQTLKKDTFLMSPGGNDCKYKVLHCLSARTSK